MAMQWQFLKLKRDQKVTRGKSLSEEHSPSPDSYRDVEGGGTNEVRDGVVSKRYFNIPCLRQEGEYQRTKIKSPYS